MGRIFAVALTCAGLLLAGCAYQGTLGSPIGVKEMGVIRKGVTTRQEVMNMLGSPQVIEQLEGRRERHTYAFQEGHVSLTNLIILPITITNAKGKVRSLVVTYDEKGIVNSYEFIAGVRIPIRDMALTPALLSY